MPIGQDKHKVVSFQYYQPWKQGGDKQFYENNKKNRIAHVAGFLVVDNDEIVTVAQSECSDYVSGQLSIPKQCIVEGTFKVYVVLPKISDDALGGGQ